MSLFDLKSSISENTFSSKPPTPKLQQWMIWQTPTWPANHPEPLQHLRDLLHTHLNLSHTCPRNSLSQCLAVLTLLQQHPARGHWQRACSAWLQVLAWARLRASHQLSDGWCWGALQHLRLVLGPKSKPESFLKFFVDPEWEEGCAEGF